MWLDCTVYIDIARQYHNLIPVSHGVTNSFNLNHVQLSQYTPKPDMFYCIIHVGPGKLLRSVL